MRAGTMGSANVKRPIFFKAITSLKHRTILMLAYSAGLRIGEPSSPLGTSGRRPFARTVYPSLLVLQDVPRTVCDDFLKHSIDRNWITS
jgi:hypothetical protein